MEVLIKLLIWVPPVLLAITLHEVAHGWVASRLGDKTALIMGRLTLNPLKHIDLVGTILLPLVLFLLGGFIFGWAKPVPVNYLNLRDPLRDMAVVAAAGPLSNLLMALMWAILAKIGLEFVDLGYPYMSFLVLMGKAGISINLMLLILNLIPIPPLDGGRVVTGLLPPSLAGYYAAIEPFGLIILIVFIFTGVLSFFLNEPYIISQGAIYRLFGL